MDYQRVYNEFIADRRLKELGLSGYTERHHIVPRSLGGGDEPENLIRLTASDHVFAHLLLAKVHGGSQWVPVLRMVNLPTHVANRHAISASRQNRFAYELAKVKNAKYQSEKRKGKPQVGFLARHAAQENKTLYRWEHKETGELVTATLKEMSAKTGLATNKLSEVAHGQVKSRGGWKLEGTVIKTTSDRAMVRRTWFTNLETGQRVFSSPLRMAKEFGGNQMLYGHAERLNGTAYGWICDGAEITAGKHANTTRALEDATKHMWVHEDGRILNATMAEMRRKFGGRSFGCVVRGRQYSSKGWYLINRVELDKAA